MIGCFKKWSLLISCLPGITMSCAARRAPAHTQAHPMPSAAASDIPPNCPDNRIMNRNYGEHYGVDFIVCRGERVIAIADGVVQYIDMSEISDDRMRGGLVSIRHSVQGRGSVLFDYSHVVNVSLKEGDHVSIGDVIGDAWIPSSSTERNRWTPHVHLQMYPYYHNPLDVLGGCRSRVVVATLVYPMSC